MKKLKFFFVFLSLSFAWQTALQAHKTITLALVGDIMMGTTFPDSVNGSTLPKDKGRHLFQSAAPILSKADIAIGNLEGVLLDRGGKLKKAKDPTLCYAFRMPTYLACNLKQAGFDVMNIANNHTFDFGREGLHSTFHTLQALHIPCTGIQRMCEKTIVCRNNLKIGVCSFSHSALALSILNLDQVKTKVKELKRQCDMVVVSFHGGSEGKDKKHLPFCMEWFAQMKRGDVTAFAHACVDAGADLVFGHGPHVVRAMELYKNKLIAYSLGNFCTPYRMSISGESGYAPLLHVTLSNNGDFQRGKIHSFVQLRGLGPLLDKENKAACEIKTLSNADFPNGKLRFDKWGNISKK